MATKEKKQKATKPEATKEAAVIRPEQLAKELNVSGKQIRAFLRSEFPRPQEQKRSSWILTKAQADAVRARFTASDDEDEE